VWGLFDDGVAALGLSAAKLSATSKSVVKKAWKAAHVEQGLCPS
jgi:hypothetical protein